MAEMFDPAAVRSNPVDMGAAKVGGSTFNAEGSARALMHDTGTGIVIAPITTAPDVARICMGLCDGLDRAAAEGARKLAE